MFPLVCVVTRQFGYFRYWIARARDLEKSVLPAGVKLFADGKTYGEGAEIRLAEQNLKMSWVGRLFKVEWLVRGLIFLCALLYVLLLWQVCHLSRNPPL